MKKILLVLLAILIVIQFFQPEKNAGSVNQSQKIEEMFETPASIAVILKDACRDCHSNNTVYPWYVSIQPIGWWLADHIKDGKRHLNFDEFGTYTDKKKDHKLEELEEMVEKKEMPLKPYSVLHENAKLSDSQRAELISWTKQVRTKIGYSGQE